MRNEELHKIKKVIPGLRSDLETKGKEGVFVKGNLKGCREK